MTESEYAHSLGHISAEVDAAIECFYTEIAMNDAARQSRVIFDKLNRDAAFWNLLRYSLLSTFFITLGRVLDDDHDALSLHKLLRVTVEHPEYFSKVSLRARKLALAQDTSNLAQGAPNWLEELLEGAWAPEVKDLRGMKKIIRPYQQKFKDVYRPIRHSVFAHNLVSGDAQHALFAKAQIPEIEDLLYFLHDLLENLTNLLWNGVRPDLGKHKYGYQNAVNIRVEALLGRLL